MNRNKNGFTLIELLVVVLIIGILAAIAVPKYQMSVMRSRATNFLSVIRTIEQAERAYYMQTGSFTYKMSDLDISWHAAPESTTAYSETYRLNPMSTFIIRTDIGEDYSCTTGTLASGSISVIFDSYWKSGYIQCRASKTDKPSQQLCATFGKLTTCDKYSASSYYCYAIGGTKPAAL